MSLIRDTNTIEKIYNYCTKIDEAHTTFNQLRLACYNLSEEIKNNNTKSMRNIENSSASIEIIFKGLSL